MGFDAIQTDVALVRIIWVDASGQHRCRVSHLFKIFCLQHFLDSNIDNSLKFDKITNVRLCELILPNSIGVV